MAKQLWKIDKFEGGLNSSSDPRDIEDNELSDATDIMVDEIGKIRMMGGIATHGTVQVPVVSTLAAGYGLFQFSHDRRDGHTAGAGIEVPTDYLAISDADATGVVRIFSNEDDTWGAPITGLTDITVGNRKDVFYCVDGIIRVCDSRFGNKNATKWYGYIDRDPFDGAYTYNHWHCTNAEIVAPSEGIVYMGDFIADAGSNDTTLINTYDTGAFVGVNNTEVTAYEAVNASDNVVVAITSKDNDNQITTPAGGSWVAGNVYYICPIGDGTGFNLIFRQTGVADGITAGTYKLAISFIYDGVQESLLYQMDGEVILDGTVYRLGVVARGEYNERITGGNVYIKEKESEDDWFILAEIDIEDGLLAVPQGRGYEALTRWTSDVTAGGDAEEIYVDQTSADYNDTGSVLNTLSYEIISGLDRNEKSINIDQFATVCIVNRRAYVGHITDDDGVAHGDRMFKSEVGKFDTFPTVNYLDVSINDGDDIIKLEEYADRILQFKKKKMHLINISQEIEFLEDTFMHKGVLHPAATCKTDYGIAWVNRQGLYLYDGKEVINLLEKDGKQKIKESDWLSFTTDNSIIGYFPKKRQLIILKDCTATSVGDIYLYDLVNKSFVKGDSKIIDTQLKTNFMTDWNNDLVIAHTGGMVVIWDDISDIVSLNLTTKDIDFGEPGQKKSIYKVYVSYLGNGSNVTVYYACDGATTINKQFNSDNTPLIDAGTTDWEVAELVPTTASEAREKYSFRLEFDGIAAADFEINDITVVYRLLGKR